MIDTIKNLEMYFEKIMRLKPGDRFLIVTDTCARPRTLGRIAMEVAGSRNIDTVLMTMRPRTHQGHEPPELVTRAMKEVDIIFEIVDEHDCTHTTARMNASAAGAKYFLAMTGISEDYFRKKISFEDLERIRDRTMRLAERLTAAKHARVTTPFGTDIAMDLDDRPGLPLHPLHDAAVSMLPDYAEAAISPIEGTSEGIIVVDAAVQEWGYILRQPLRLTVKNGRVENVTGLAPDVKRFEEMIATDGYANNCAAELGIGTSHTISKNLCGTIWEYALLGTVHIAVGRNNDIGGATLSKIHKDVLMTQPTVVLNGVEVLKNGELLI